MSNIPNFLYVSFVTLFLISPLLKSAILPSIELFARQTASKSKYYEDSFFQENFHEK